MPIFSPRPIAPNTSALNNVQASISPTPNSTNPSNGTVEYSVQLVGNMTELVSDGINNISLSAEQQISSTPVTSIGQINNMLNSMAPLAASYSAPIMSIDPKETVSHGVLGSMPSVGAMATQATPALSSMIEETQVVFAEVPFNDRLNRNSINIEHAIAGDLNFSHGTHSLPDTHSLMSAVQPHSISVSTNTSRPAIAELRTSAVPERTVKNISVRVPIGTVPTLSIQNRLGQNLGTVGERAANVLGPRIPPTEIKHVGFFSQITAQRRMIDISFSERNNRPMIHVTTPFSRGITHFTIHVRQLTKTPKFDKYTVMGTYPLGKAANLSFPFDLSKKHMVHVIPEYHGEPLCYSATEVTTGVVDDYDCSYMCYQKGARAVEFIISNIPIDVKRIHAIRTDELSGETAPLNDRIIRTGNRKMSGRKQEAQAPSLTYPDPVISQKNSVYSYDFFALNKFGLEKHLFRTTLPIYEKDALGMVFKDAKLSRNQVGDHVISCVLKYPDAFLPKNENYSLVNPDDDFIEACRNAKRVCIMSIKRHTPNGHTDNLGIHILNPGELNTLKSEINATGDFIVRLPITRSFLRGQGVQSLTNPNIEYRYELRLGSYLLSNELSFLKNPIKMFVPNEFTNGKTAYSYDPIIYDTPARKDRGLLGRMGSSRRHILELALTSKSRILVSDFVEQPDPKRGTMKAKLVPLNNTQTKFAVKLEATLEGNFAMKYDHAELLVSDSSTGEYVSLGKHRLITSDFYFLDTKSVNLACNKLKYKLVVRSIDFINVYDMVSNVVDIGLTNVKIEKRTSRQHSGTPSSLQTAAFRGFR